MAEADRPKVKAECLRLLATLRLDPARNRLISGFVDTYLRLNQQEEQAFQEELGKIELSERERVMQIVTSWMEQGIEQGTEREKLLVLRQLTRQLGDLPTVIQSQVLALPIEQVENLGEALFDFVALTDLEQWLLTQSQ